MQLEAQETCPRTPEPASTPPSENPKSSPHTARAPRSLPEEPRRHRRLFPSGLAGPKQPCTLRDPSPSSCLNCGTSQPTLG